MGKQINVALVGNPNTGKTSVFNQLTGLTQKIGNYPGITVEKKEGVTKISRILTAHILDLPGTYSLNASSLDENIVIELLMNKNHKDYPDVVVVVSDIENLKRNLLLFTQIKDLGIPTILAINMADRMERKGIELDIPQMEEQLKTKIALVSARKKTGFDELKKHIKNYSLLPTTPCCNVSSIDKSYFDKLQKTYPEQDLYKLWLLITHDANFGELDRKTIESKNGLPQKTKDQIKKLQHKEVVARYQFINGMLKSCFKQDLNLAKGMRAQLDKVLTHPVWGYLVFFVILLLIFQAIYDWSTIPMDWIDEGFAYLGQWVKLNLPAGMFTNLLAEGVVPGIGGIVIFIPQIAMLFLFISILEETGYMSRVVFLMDKSMRKFGLSGKSVIPLVSGTACAIPAVMAARNIENWKERLITILVVPFTTCSARLPVYLIIISLVIPDEHLLGFISYQALALMAMYIIGFGAAIAAAWIANKSLRVGTKSSFVIEMPDYKLPIFKNVGLTVVDKTKAFVVGAGKIILSISIILWVLASFGPSDTFDNARENVQAEMASTDQQLQDVDLEQRIASYKLKHSYMGIMGRGIEPAVTPLGYDWKIGIALISSFAAREVFVGTLATIYSVGTDDQITIKERLAGEKNTATGKPLFTLASGISLLLFYAFAMQCMSTLAIVKRETNSWKWPLLQLFLMTGFAYLTALIAYQLLNL